MSLNRLVARLTDMDLDKLMKLKLEDAECREMSNEYFLTKLVRAKLRTVSLLTTFEETVQKSTAKALGGIWAENFTLNIPELMDREKCMNAMKEDLRKNGKEIEKTHRNPLIPLSLSEEKGLNSIKKRENQPCLCVAAGPSIHEHGHIKMLAERGWKGPVLTTDRMLRPLLEAGVSPANGFDLICANVDGHRVIIPRFFKDDEGRPLKADGVTGMFVSSTAPQTIEAAKAAGMSVHWFHGMLDNFDIEGSYTNWMNKMVAVPCIAAGGNVGATCLVLALYIWCNPVVYIGLDLGYTPDTPIEETAYYHTFSEKGASVEQMLTIFSEGFNPDFGVAYKQDIVFKGYTSSLLGMIETRQYEAEYKKGQPGMYPVEVISATEGGALHHPTLVKGMKFSQALDLYGRN